MTTLLFKKLVTTLEQDLRYNSAKRCQIAAFIPYIYMHNSPSGTFIFELLNEDAEVIFSQSFDSAGIKQSLVTTNNYAHVFYPIVPTNPIQIERGLYTIKLSATGYTPSDSSYLGWIQQYENVQNVMDYVPASDAENSLAIRIKKWE